MGSSARQSVSLIILATLFVLSGCGGGGGGGGSPATGAPPAPGGIPAGVFKGNVVFADPAVSSQLIRSAQSAGEPVPNAKVEVEGLPFSNFTDSNGYFIIQDLPPGIFKIIITKDKDKDGVPDYIGYWDLLMPADQGVEATISAAETGVITGRVTIEGAASGNGGIQVCTDNGGYCGFTWDNGDFTIENVGCNTSYHVVAFKSCYSTETSAEEIYVKCGKGNTVTIDDMALSFIGCGTPLPTGNIQGHAYLLDKTDHSGIVIELSDGSLTTTLADGSYSFADVPTGLYGIKASMNGYIPVSINHFMVDVGITNTVSDMFLANVLDPDCDGDGVPNSQDLDDDNDGFPDDDEDEYLTDTCDPASVPVGDLYGMVLDSDTGEPVFGTLVGIAGTDKLAITDPLGQFTLTDLHAGPNVLVALRSGYSMAFTTAYVFPGQTSSIIIYLSGAEANTAPTAEITSPSSGLSFNEGDTINFSGLIGDLEDPVTDVLALWISSIDGPLNSEPPDQMGLVNFSYDSLSVGTHLITLMAKDSGGLSGEDHVAITVQPAAPPAQPILCIAPNYLDFGDTDTVRQVYVSNCGAGTLNWSMTSNRSWLSAFPSSGAIDATSPPVAVDVTVNRAGVVAGLSYSGALSVQSDGGNNLVVAQMYVPNNNPSVAVDCPASVAENSPAVCSLTASDPDSPPQILSCSLDAATSCIGASISGCTQVNIPAQGELAGPGSCTVVVDVADNSNPQGTGQGSDLMTIDEVNVNPLWNVLPADIDVSILESYGQDNGQAVDSDMPGSVASDPGYLTCSKVSQTCSFPVTVTGAGNGVVDCHVGFTADITNEDCLVTLQVSDGWSPAAVISDVINISVTGEDIISMDCPADASETAGISCPLLSAEGISVCTVGPNDTCGGSIDIGCVGPYTAPAQGEAVGPGSCVAEVVKGAASASSAISILEENQQPNIVSSDIHHWFALNPSVPPFPPYQSTTNVSGTDNDLPNSTPTDPGYLACSKTAQSCSFDISVSGSGSGSVACDISFIPTNDNEECDVTVRITDGLGAYSDSILPVYVYDACNTVQLNCSSGNSVDEGSQLECDIANYINECGGAGVSASDTCGGEIDFWSNPYEVYIFTPGEAQGPGTCLLAVTNGVGYDEQTITINEVNQNPSITVDCPANAGENSATSCTLTASDPDSPLQTLTCSVNVASTCTGVTLSGCSQADIPAQGEAAGTSCVVVIDVQDDFTAPGTGQGSDTITIDEENQNPTVTVDCPANVGEDTATSCTLTAGDPDLPPQTLTCSVNAATTCAGVTLTGCTQANVPAQGEAAGPGSCSVVIDVQDNYTVPGTGQGSDTIIIDNQNQAPYFQNPDPVFMPCDGCRICTYNWDTQPVDPDVPSDTLSFSITTWDPYQSAPCVATYATIDGNGVISIEIDNHSLPLTGGGGASEYCMLDVTVTDDGNPPMMNSAQTIIQAWNMGPIGLYNGPANSTATAGYLYNQMTLLCTDLDSDPLSYWDGPGNTCSGSVMFSGDYWWTPTPAEAAAGYCNIDVGCGDGCLPGQAIYSVSVISPGNCYDGLDNDGDTFIDYGSDPDCTSVDDPSETAMGCCRFDLNPSYGTVTVSGTPPPEFAISTENASWSYGTNTFDFDVKLKWLDPDNHIENASLRVTEGDTAAFNASIENQDIGSGSIGANLPGVNPGIVYVADSIADGPESFIACDPLNPTDCTNTPFTYINAECGTRIAHWVVSEPSGSPYSFWVDLFKDIYPVNLTDDPRYDPGRMSVYLRTYKMDPMDNTYPVETDQSNQIAPGEWFYVHYYLDYPGNNRNLPYSSDVMEGPRRMEDTGNIAAWGYGSDPFATYWYMSWASWAIRFDPAVVEMNSSVNPDYSDPPGNGLFVFQTDGGTSLKMINDPNGSTDGVDVSSGTQYAAINMIGLFKQITSPLYTTTSYYPNPCGRADLNRYSCNSGHGTDGFDTIDWDVGYVPMRAKALVQPGTGSPIHISFDAHTGFIAGSTAGYPYNSSVHPTTLIFPSSGSWPDWCNPALPRGSCSWDFPNAERSYICIQ